MSKTGDWLIEMQQAHVEGKCIRNCQICKDEKRLGGLQDYSFDGYEEDEIECSTPDIDAVQIAQEDLIQ